MARLPTLWNEPMNLLRNLDNLFEDYAPSRMLSDRTDIYEKDGHLKIETELPGVNREDIHVRVEGDQLVVTGETKRETNVEEENFVRMGRSVGRFRRAFPLPDEVEDPNKIEAHYDDGILKIDVPLQTSLSGDDETVEIDVK
ncbi:MAG: Hsp20/alpha crystallin family protein [Candidatus Bipolaricaulia bacterium]